MLPRYTKIDRKLQIKMSKAGWRAGPFERTGSGWRTQRSEWIASKPKPDVHSLALDLCPHTLRTQWNVNTESLTLWDPLWKSQLPAATTLAVWPCTSWHTAPGGSSIFRIFKLEGIPQARKLHPVIFTADKHCEVEQWPPTPPVAWRD